VAASNPVESSSGRGPEAQSGVDSSTSSAPQASSQVNLAASNPVASSSGRGPEAQSGVVSSTSSVPQASSQVNVAASNPVESSPGRAPEAQSGVVSSTSSSSQPISQVNVAVSNPVASSSGKAQEAHTGVVSSASSAPQLNVAASNPVAPSSGRAQEAVIGVVSSASSVPQVNAATSNPVASTSGKKGLGKGGTVLIKAPIDRSHFVSGDRYPVAKLPNDQSQVGSIAILIHFLDRWIPSEIPVSVILDQANQFCMRNKGCDILLTISSSQTEFEDDMSRMFEKSLKAKYEFVRVLVFGHGLSQHASEGQQTVSHLATRFPVHGDKALDGMDMRTCLRTCFQKSVSVNSIGVVFCNEHTVNRRKDRRNFAKPKDVKRNCGLMIPKSVETRVILSTFEDVSTEATCWNLAELLTMFQNNGLPFPYFTNTRFEDFREKTFDQVIADEELSYKAILCQNRMLVVESMGIADHHEKVKCMTKLDNLFKQYQDKHQKWKYQ
jgi:hypothetical protein